MDTGTVRQFLAGVRLLGRGLSLYRGSGRLVLLGIVPAVISGALLVGGFVTLFRFLDDLAAAATWFAADWSPGVRAFTRIVAGVGIAGAGVFLGVLSFTVLTLLIGDPFYEKISELVEDRFGGVPGEVDLPWWRSLRRSLVDSVRLVAVSFCVGVPLFFAGFIPVLGQTLIPVLAAAVGGWFLAVELVGAPFARRGLRLSDRRAALAAHRPLAIGFGMSVFLCFLVPFGAVLVMPGAVAGGTLLARRVLALPTAADR